MTLIVKHAVYGALTGQPHHGGSFDVTQVLQQRVMGRDGRGVGVVPCNDAIFGDPAPGVVKNFGAVVNRDGNDFLFACQEGQTIDFTHAGTPLSRPDTYVKFAVYGAAAGGGTFDVSHILEQLLARNHFVPCTNESFGGDPAPGIVKHFAAIVSRHGRDIAVACQEGQTVDFS